MRRRNVKHAHERVLNAEGLMILNPNDYKGEWNSLFGNDNPIYLEIGMGKGKFIIEHATRNPNINYIGIEKYESVIIQAVDKIKDNPPSNLHFIAGNADKLLDMFEEKEISKIFLNFSDPWPKNKHEKRRLTYKSFLEIYDTILDGEIEFKTDNRGLFEFSLVSLNENNWSFLDLTFDLHSISDESLITTEYEDKFSQKGNPIYFVRTKKK